MGVCIAMTSIDVCLYFVGQGNIYQGERSKSSGDTDYEEVMKTAEW
jgi:hypothetical protein